MTTTQLLAFFVASLLSLSLMSKAQNPQIVTSSEGAVLVEKVGSSLFYVRILDSSGQNVQELWRLDAPYTTPTRITSLGVLFSPVGSVTLPYSVGAKFYFVTTDAAAQRLWVCDGTSSGTVCLDSAFKIYAMCGFNDKLYYSVYDFSQSPGLYVTDGSIAGCHLVSAQTTLADQYRQGEMGVFNYATFNDRLFFSVLKGDPKLSTTWYAEIWAYNDKTNTLKRLDSNSSIAGYTKAFYDKYTSRFFREYQGKLYYVMVDKAAQTTLLKRTDGTSVETVNSVLGYQPMAVVNDRLILLGQTTKNGLELYATDASGNGTTLLKDVNSTPSFLSSNPGHFCTTCNHLFFIAEDNGNGNGTERIWQTDGTPTGTMVFTPERGSYYYLSKLSNGSVYYLVDPGVGNEDTLSFYRIDSTSCSQALVTTWSKLDYGAFVDAIQVNPLFAILGGGAKGPTALYNLVSNVTNSVDERKSDETIPLCYPNPVNDHMNLRADVDEVSVYSLCGEKILSSCPTERRINVQSIPAGSYHAISRVGLSYHIQTLVIIH